MNREQKIAAICLASVFGVAMLVVVIVLVVSGGSGGRAKVYTVPELLTEIEIDRTRFLGKRVVVTGTLDGTWPAAKGTWLYLDGKGEKNSNLHIVAGFNFREREAPPRGKMLTIEGRIHHIKPNFVEHEGQVLLVECSFR